MSISKYLTTTEVQKVFALIYGPPVTGKTTGARTFPNPYIVDVDHNLPAGVSNVIPIWDEKFIDGIKPRVSSAIANRRDALLVVLADLSKELTAKDTIIIDSLTRIETWFNVQEELEPQPRGKAGAPDGHAMFRKRLLYFDTLFTMLTSCPANVVFTVHQQQERNERGDVTGQIKASLQGQIGEKMPGYFPIVLQAIRQINPTSKEVNFVWRVRPGLYEAARVPKPVTVDFIPQNYNELLKLL
jgi:hypothetical protein